MLGAHTHKPGVNSSLERGASLTFLKSFITIYIYIYIYIYDKSKIIVFHENF